MIKIKRVRHKNPHLPPYIGLNPKNNLPYYFCRQRKEGSFHISFKTLEEAIIFKDNHNKLHGDKHITTQKEIIKQYKIKNNLNYYVPSKLLPKIYNQKYKEVVLKNGETWFYYWLEPLTSNTQQ